MSGIRTLVVIGTDWVVNCKSNYHTTTAATVPILLQSWFLIPTHRGIDIETASVVSIVLASSVVDCWVEFCGWVTPNTIKLVFV
jgi:hypothetical protein